MPSKEHLRISALYLCQLLFFCCFFYSTVMQLLLVKIEVGSVRVCTCAKNTHCACSTCQCVHLYLWGGVMWQQTFSRSVIERWDTGVCSMHFITCTQVHTKYKVQTMSQPYIKYMGDVCVQGYGALMVI